MVEVAQGLQGLFSALGFPVAILVVLLTANWFAAKSVLAFVTTKFQEASERERRLAARLDEVENKTVALLTETVAENTRTLGQVNVTLLDMRRHCVGGSGARVAVDTK